jgi:hypothetical protein
MDDKPRDHRSLTHEMEPRFQPPNHAAQRTGGSAAPNSADRQRWGTAPAARTVPRIDWNELLGVSCNRLLGGSYLDCDPKIESGVVSSVKK